MVKNHYKREKYKERKLLEEKIIKLREEGKSIRKIAKELGLTYNKVWRYIHGVSSNKKKPRGLYAKALKELNPNANYVLKSMYLRFIWLDKKIDLYEDDDTKALKYLSKLVRLANSLVKLFKLTGNSYSEENDLVLLLMKIAEEKKKEEERKE